MTRVRARPFRNARRPEGRARGRRGNPRARLGEQAAVFAGLALCLAPVPPPVSAAPAVPQVAPASAAAPARAFKRLPNGDIQLGKIRLHRKARVLSFPARLALAAGALEVLIATPDGRVYESLFSSPASPLHLQTMLYLLGLENGPRLPDAAGRRGDLVDLDVQWCDARGRKHRMPIERFILDRRTHRCMRRLGWVFTGSSIQNGKFLAETEGNLALLFSSGDTVLDCADPDATDDTLFSVNTAGIPLRAGAPVTIFLIPRKHTPKKPEGARSKVAAPPAQ